MINLDNNIKMTLIGFAVISIIIYQLKPRFIFHENGSFKQFGLTKDKTIYPYWLVIIISGFLIYSVCLIKGGNYV